MYKFESIFPKLKFAPTFLLILSTFAISFNLQSCSKDCEKGDWVYVFENKPFKKPAMYYKGSRDCNNLSPTPPKSETDLRLFQLTTGKKTYDYKKLLKRCKKEKYYTYDRILPKNKHAKDLLFLMDKKEISKEDLLALKLNKRLKIIIE